MEILTPYIKEFKYTQYDKIERFENGELRLIPDKPRQRIKHEWVLGERIITSIVNHFKNKYNIDFTKPNSIDIIHVNNNKDNIVKDILKALKNTNVDFKQIYPIIYLFKSNGIDWNEFKIIEKSFDPIPTFDCNLFELIIDFN